jgi:transposase
VAKSCRLGPDIRRNVGDAGILAHLSNGDKNVKVERPAVSRRDFRRSISARRQVLASVMDLRRRPVVDVVRWMGETGDHWQETTITTGPADDARQYAQPRGAGSLGCRPRSDTTTRRGSTSTATPDDGEPPRASHLVHLCGIIGADARPNSREQTAKYRVLHSD